MTKTTPVAEKRTFDPKYSMQTSIQTKILHTQIFWKVTINFIIKNMFILLGLPKMWKSDQITYLCFKRVELIRLHGKARLTTNAPSLPFELISLLLQCIHKFWKNWGVNTTVLWCNSHTNLFLTHGKIYFYITEAVGIQNSNIFNFLNVTKFILCMHNCITKYYLLLNFIYCDIYKSYII